MRARITGCACGMPRKVNGSEDSVDIGTSYLCVYNLIQCPHVQVHMAGTAEVVTLMDKLPGVTYQVLVSNEKGLETALCLLAAHPDKPPVDEIAVFTAAIDASSLVNTNATVAAWSASFGSAGQGHQGSRVHQRRHYVSVRRQCGLAPRAGRGEGVAGYGVL